MFFSLLVRCLLCQLWCNWEHNGTLITFRWFFEWKRNLFGHKTSSSHLILCLQPKKRKRYRHEIMLYMVHPLFWERKRNATDVLTASWNIFSAVWVGILSFFSSFFVYSFIAMYVHVSWYKCNYIEYQHFVWVTHSFDIVFGFRSDHFAFVL